MALRGIRRSTT